MPRQGLCCMTPSSEYWAALDDVHQVDGEEPMSSKVHETAASAVADVTTGSSLAVGGFGLCGIPDALIEAIAESGATDLAVFSNNCGVDDHGLGVLLSHKRIRRVTASYVGENKE